MLWLCLGLLLFLGVHSSRIVADGWRTRFIAERGEGTWKGLYTVLSLLGLALIVWGYGAARSQPVLMWIPPPAMKSVAALLMLLAFVLLAATYVPRNHIRAAVGHPMVLSVKVWALAHLLANQLLADMLLFGAFLVWAVLSFRAARARDRAVPPPQRPAATLAGTALTVVIGIVAWLVFAFALHAWLFGVAPFGR